MITEMLEQVHQEIEGKEMRKFHKRYDYLIRELGQFVSLRGKTVIDCGCGEGDGAIHFARKKCETIGMDVSKKRIRIAKAAFPQIDFRVKSILDTGLPDDSVDVFICSETLEHLTRSQSLKAAEEIGRVCKPISHVCITVPENKKVCLDKKGHKQYLSSKTVCRHFREWEVILNDIFYKNPKNKKRGNRVVIFTRK